MIWVERKPPGPFSETLSRKCFENRHPRPRLCFLQGDEFYEENPAELLAIRDQFEADQASKEDMTRKRTKPSKRTFAKAPPMDDSAKAHSSVLPLYSIATKENFCEVLRKRLPSWKCCRNSPTTMRLGAHGPRLGFLVCHCCGRPWLWAHVTRGSAHNHRLRPRPLLMRRSRRDSK